MKLEKEFLSEEQTMEFLNYNESSMKNLRKSKVLSRYQKGHRFFYDKNEVVKLIEDSKVYAQDINEYQQYIQNMNKGLSDTKINGFERSFVLKYARSFLDSINKLIDDANLLTHRDKYILDNCLSNMNFKEVAEKCKLTPARVGSIFHKSLRITTRLCLQMKNNYEKNYLPLQQEIELLKKQNHELKSQLFELNKNSQFLADYTDSVLYTSIFDLDASVRLINVLKINNLMTLGDIVRHERKDFLRFRNFGSKSLSELIDILEQYDLKLKR
jgi:hypothetical protein